MHQTVQGTLRPVFSSRQLLVASTAKPVTPLKQDALGRVTLPRAQREALLDEFERSGIKELPFALMPGVNYQTFASWIQKRRHARGDYLKAAPAPVPPPSRPAPAKAARYKATAAVQLVELALPACMVSVPVADGEAAGGGHVRLAQSGSRGLGEAGA